MKKLLIGSLVLAMVLGFSGAANAQYWWKSTQMNDSIKIIYPKYSKGNKTFGNVNGKFTGYMVVNSTTANQDAAIEQVFLCGTITVSVADIALNVWLNYEDEASISFQFTDHSAEPSSGKTDKESGTVIGIGTFYDQTKSMSGPAYFNGTLTLTEDTNDNVKSMTVKGAVVGGYGQAFGSLYQFSSSHNTVLTPYTGTTPLTCDNGEVVGP